ncbi:MAG: YraN family protein [Patescibacteria group bacterium]
MKTKEVGQIGESIACKFLERQGYTIVERNYRLKHAEIDIIAKKGTTIHFVEVKSLRTKVIPVVSRETTERKPEDLVHPLKLRKIESAALFYMDRYTGNFDFQIDVVGVFIDERRRFGRCRLIENANSS